MYYTIDKNIAGDGYWIQLGAFWIRTKRYNGEVELGIGWMDVWTFNVSFEKIR